jgi:hypothetical protein
MSMHAGPPSSCSACQAPITDPTATFYDTSGNLVCALCHAREEDAAALERVRDKRTHLIVGTAASLSAVVALAGFAYAYRDRTYVYVKGGGDASFEILKMGLGFAAVVAFVVGFAVNWAVDKSHESKKKAAR